MEYRAFDKQSEFHLDKSRFRAALAGKRGGKTECGAIETILHLEQKLGECPSEVDQYTGIILAPTTDMLRRLSLKKFLAYAKPFKPDHHQTFNEVYWHNDALVYGISGDKPARIEGIKANFIWIDEVFQVSEQLFLECLARVSDTRGRIWVTGSMGVQWTNPKSHWVYKYFKENPSPEYKCFEWATLDNPYFPKEEIELLKEKLDPRTYRQMFTIDWNVPGTAMVYDDLDESSLYEHTYKPHLETYLSIDWGWAHDMACLFFQYDRAKDTVYLFDEIVAPKMTLDRLWERINSKGYHIKEWICDIAGTQEREQTGRSNVNWFRDNHKVVLKYRSSAVQYGISIVRSYVKNSNAQRRLLISSKKCPKTWDQLCNYRYPEKNGVIQNENPVKENDDACFSGETMISTSLGQKKIKNIIPGDMVITRSGLKTVTANTVRTAETWLFNTPNGLIRCTGSHKFFNGKSFNRIDSFTSVDRMYTVSSLWQTLKESNGMASNIGDTQIRNIGIIQSIFKEGLRLASRIFIGMFGRFITQKYQKAFTSIISTVIRQITTSKIFVSLMQEITLSITLQKILKTMNSEKKIQNTLEISDGSQKNGTHQKMAQGGITTIIKNLLERMSDLKRNVKYAVMSLTQRSTQKDFALIIASLKIEDAAALTTSLGPVLFAGYNSSVTNTQNKETAQKSALRVLGSDRTETVYDLTVEDVHEYFANGVLVSNCDALRYFFVNVLDSSVKNTFNEFNRWSI